MTKHIVGKIPNYGVFCPTVLCFSLFCPCGVCVIMRQIEKYMQQNSNAHVRMENYFERVDKSVALIVINFALVKTRKTKI